MSERRELARGWLHKAESDLAAVELAIAAGRALDAACFHAQQAAEKVLKGYLTARAIDFPFTHNLARLLALCEPLDAEFSTLNPQANFLTPFAVDVRYDLDFWPTLDVAREAHHAAVTIRDFVLERMPPMLAAEEPDTSPTA